MSLRNVFHLLPASQPSDTTRGAEHSNLDNRSFREHETRRILSQATTVEDVERVDDDTRIKLELAMSDRLQPLQYSSNNYLTLPSFNGPDDITSPPRRMRERSINVEGGWTVLEPADRPVYFLRDFQNINSQRQDIQLKRIKAREERNKMKVSRQRLLEAGSELLKATRRLRSPVEGDEHDMSAQIENLENIMNELDTQEVYYDGLEGELIPAEWELKEAEQELYNQILGAAPPDQNESEGDTRPTPRTPRNVPPSNLIGPTTPQRYATTAKERLMELAYHEREVRNLLANLEADHAALQAEAETRARVGVPLDDYSQQLLDTYPQRRGRLWQDLAAIADETVGLEETVIPSRSPTSRASDVLFSLDQFVGVNTDAKIQRSEADGDQTLDLNTGDFDEERANDLRPVLDCWSNPEKAKQVSPVASDMSSQGAESLSHFVRTWIFGCVQSSWWSFVRFVFLGNFEDKMTLTTIKSYIMRMPLGQGLFPLPLSDWSEDPESVDSSVLPYFENLTWSPDTRFTYELQPASLQPQRQTRRLQRRHSSSKFATRPRSRTSHSRANTQ